MEEIDYKILIWPIMVLGSYGIAQILLAITLTYIESIR